MRLLLGFGNKARHGKDGAARAIENYFDARRSHATLHGLRSKIPAIKRIGFADALRRESTEAIRQAGGIKALLEQGFQDDVTRNWVFFPDWVTADPNPDMSDPLLPFGKHPKLLQWWGTEYRRNQNPDYWIEQARKAFTGFGGIGMITDVRFKNEAKFVKEDPNGFVINVTRTNEDGTLFADPNRPSNHPSEIDLDGYNFDGYIRTKTGQAALAGELAITMANFFYEITS